MQVLGTPNLGSYLSNPNIIDQFKLEALQTRIFFEENINITENVTMG